MTQEQLIQQALSALAHFGVREVCIAAGARNAPLIAALLTSPGIKIWNFFEERSAAFFALGRMIVDRKPVAVVTTSGTAAAECLPAVIEAHYQGLPLFVLTADRPKSYRGSGAPQAIEQHHLFGVYAQMLGDWDVTDESLAMYQTTDDRPRHLNVCLDEPLETNIIGVDFSRAQTPVLEARTHACSLDCDLVLASGMHPADAKEAAPMLAKLGAPIVAEATSNLHHFRDLQPLLIPGGERALQSAKPTHVLRLGAVPSWRWWRDLESQPKIRVTNITRSGFSGLARKEEVVTLPWEAVKSAQCPAACASCGILRFEPELEKFEQSEPNWMRKLIEVIPARSRVFLGNSLPIRELNLALKSAQPGVDFFANRGANGIDGLVSTFLGVSASHREECWLIVGDLSTLYDLAAPWVIAQMDHPKLRIVVINNGGGKIFSRVNSLRALSEKSLAVIENRHELGFEPWAQMWGMEYVQTDDASDLVDLLHVPIVIEIRPNPLQTEAFWKDWQRPVIRPR
ncbi:2-succinyl-5-enolpyruvyl-6-hydroxy-3-cyclohexene-1-carboxylic-acid synthase [Prosthecobacter sp.]|jgi:2-succinyl-5-enolpyruvyl-6-hydroxy-3-cyclohexene-1-carboxylate synthase|uniref:2-succinyl-5-enolpyruvyl-6-hydroxy-3- cyclohexene-1-carboxylic-acid synthase n=1 Tax=Prosthecobacter sp. TaxID=1965333 RepID=UPI0037830F7A